MSVTRALSASVAALVLGACTWCACGPERPPQEAPATTQAATPAAAARDAFTPPGPDGYGRAGTLRYLEHVVGGVTPEQALPMVVVIHGLGDRPGPHWLDLVQLQRPVRVIMPEAPTPYFEGFSWFPFRAHDTDPRALAAGIDRAAGLVADALALLAKKRPTRGRPLVTGFSQGGMLSFALALRHPQQVGFALPISGTLPEPLWPNSAPKGAPNSAPAPGTPKIVALHGTADELVPFAPTAQLVERLRALRYDATLVPYDGVGHAISDAMRQRVSHELDAALTVSEP